MIYEYYPKGVCSRKIKLELDGGIIHNVQFEGGCSGNTQGICALVEGMTAEEACAKLKGIRCGMKPTSCPDQLAKALETAAGKTT